MAGPAFAPDACIALPSAKIAVMGPEPAVNAVFANRIAGIEDLDEREAFVADRRQEYEADVDLMRLASDLVIDAVIQPEHLRGELVRRFALAESKTRWFSDRRHGVPPV
jgi:acetyl-CoA carboxylase carboxyltransferase component